MNYAAPDNSNFATLKQAMQHANTHEQTEIRLTHLNECETIYRLHPMTERLERVQTVREAKMKLKSNIFYHGSPILINDENMASETYFSSDIEIAKTYGNFIYSIRLNEKTRNIMQLDALGEHFVSCRLIPLHLFNIEKF